MKADGNPQNLTPFKKGESGNPNGRPRKLPELEALLAEVLSEETNGITAMQAILMGLVAKAKRGDVRAAELLLNRAYGKQKETINTNLNWPGGVHVIEADFSE